MQYCSFCIANYDAILLILYRKLRCNTAYFVSQITMQYCLFCIANYNAILLILYRKLRCNTAYLIPYNSKEVFQDLSLASRILKARFLCSLALKLKFLAFAFALPWPGLALTLTLDPRLAMALKYMSYKFDTIHIK